MRRAFNLIRDDPVYRRQAFDRGLAAAGFVVQPRNVSLNPRAGDVLLMWNRYGHWHDIATQFETAGAQVLVAENAYCANDRSNRQRYALALAGHNGQGMWPLGGPERWEALGLEVKPYRTQGDHILVCPNRSFGVPGYIMPPMWPEEVVRILQRRTKRPVRLRPHPGNNPPKVPLVNDLRNAWAVVIWSSSAGVEALLEGIPVWCQAPAWVCKPATLGSISDLETTALPDRMPALHSMAWQQWHITEIESGEPFQHLLHRAPTFAGRV